MATQRVDQHGALANQKITCPVQTQDRLLLGAFDRGKLNRPGIVGGSNS